MTGFGRRMGRFLAALLICGITSAAEARDPIFGRWVVESGKAVIELSPCGENACGRLVWLANPFTLGGANKTDLKNPDPALRGRPLCGLRLVSGLREIRPGRWKGGEIYSTRDGKTYGLDIEATGSGLLSVRGYLGISLLGRTQTWRRDPPPNRQCTNLDRPGIDR